MFKLFCINKKTKKFSRLGRFSSSFIFLNLLLIKILKSTLENPSITASGLQDLSYFSEREKIICEILEEIGISKAEQEAGKISRFRNNSTKETSKPSQI